MFFLFLNRLQYLVIPSHLGMLKTINFKILTLKYYGIFKIFINMNNIKNYFTFKNIIMVDKEDGF